MNTNTNTNTNENAVIGKSIFAPNTARRLLRMGNTIIDIKPNKNNYEKTIFIFRDDEKLRSDMSAISGRNTTE